MSLVLRVVGSDVAVEQLQARLDLERVAVSWKRGAKLRHGFATSAGVNIVLSDEDELREGFVEGERVFVQVIDIVKTLELEVSLQVRVALFVRATSTASAVIPTSFIDVASAAKAEIAVRAYPCSDEDD